MLTVVERSRDGIPRSRKRTSADDVGNKRPNKLLKGVPAVDYGPRTHGLYQVTSQWHAERDLSSRCENWHYNSWDQSQQQRIGNT